MHSFFFQFIYSTQKYSFFFHHRALSLSLSLSVCLSVCVCVCVVCVVCCVLCVCVFDDDTMMNGSLDDDENDDENENDDATAKETMRRKKIEDASRNAKAWALAGLPPLPTTDEWAKKALNALMRQESFDRALSSSSTHANDFDASTLVVESNNNKEEEISTGVVGEADVAAATRGRKSREDTPDKPSSSSSSIFTGKQTSALTSHLRRVDSTLLANTVMQRPEDDPDAAARLEETSTTMDADGKTTTRMKKLTPEDFEALYLVGQGAFGKVFQVRKKDTGVLYAMKVMKKEVVIAKEQMEYTKQERDILTSITHPYVVKLRFSFQTATKLYLVLDFINGGHLFYWMYREGMFDVELTRFYVAEIVCGIGHLHSLNIMHRDLKPENILVDREGHVRITDFGLAKKFSSDGEKANSLVGSIDYMAPEILKDKGHGKEADWWSVGVLLYEMLIGQLPFRGKNKAAIQKAITTQKIKMPSFVEIDAAKLIQNLTTKDPNRRLGSDANSKDSTSKNGTEEVKKHKFFSKINWTKLEKREVPAPFVPKIDREKGDGCVAHFDKKWTDAKVHAEAESAAASPSSAEQHHFLGFTYVSPTQLAYFESKLSADENERSDGRREDDDDLRKLTAATRNINMDNNNNNNNNNYNNNNNNDIKTRNGKIIKRNEGKEDLSFDEETALYNANNSTINTTFDNDRSSTCSSSSSPSRVGDDDDDDDEEEEEDEDVRRRFHQRTPPPRLDGNNTNNVKSEDDTSSVNTSGRTTPISVNKPKGGGSRSQSPWMR